MYIQTPHYTVESEPRTGALIVRNRHSGESVYLQGEDVLAFEAETENCPAKYLDEAIGHCVALGGYGS